MPVESQHSLKELIPKMGPRLRLKAAFEAAYGVKSTECKINFSTSTSDSATTSSGNIALKGQMKLQVGPEGWSLTQLNEQVLLDI